MPVLDLAVDDTGRHPAVRPWDDDGQALATITRELVCMADGIQQSDGLRRRVGGETGRNSEVRAPDGAEG